MRFSQASFANLFETRRLFGAAIEFIVPAMRSILGVTEPSTAGFVGIIRLLRDILDATSPGFPACRRVRAGCDCRAATDLYEISEKDSGHRSGAPPLNECLFKSYLFAVKWDHYVPARSVLAQIFG